MPKTRLPRIDLATLVTIPTTHPLGHIGDVSRAIVRNAAVQFSATEAAASLLVSERTYYRALAAMYHANKSDRYGDTISGGYPLEITTKTAISGKPSRHEHDINVSHSRHNPRGKQRKVAKAGN